MKKLFTLIELIVVIVVLGVLAAIVIPNISSFKEEAIKTEVVANTTNLQTVTDLYALKNNGAVPTKAIPTIGNPTRVDLEELYPKYIRDKEFKHGFYWIDHTGKVWGSTIDAPRGLAYKDDTVSFEAVNDAIEYELFGYGEQGIQGAANGQSARSLENIVVDEPLKIITKKLPMAKQSEGYLVSAVDKFGLPTAPVGKMYDGYDSIFPISQSFNLVTNAHGQADWLGLFTVEEKPGNSKINYTFETSNNGVDYVPVVGGIEGAPDSQYLKVKVEMVASNGQYPTIHKMKVQFKLDGEEYAEADLIADKTHSEGTKDQLGDIVLEDNASEGRIEHVIEFPSENYFEEVQVIGEVPVGGSIDTSYQSSKDGVNWSIEVLHPEELPEGKYIKVINEIKRDNTEIPSPTIEKIIAKQTDSNPNTGPTPPVVEDPIEEEEPVPTPEVEWETILSLNIIEDATNVGDWISVIVDDTKPTGTRIIYEYFTSIDGTNWTKYNTLEEAPNSRYLKVAVRYEREKGTSNTPQLIQMTINYKMQDGSNKSSVKYKDGVEVVNTGIPVEEIALGEYVQFGTHLNGQPMKWNIVKKDSTSMMLFMTEPIKNTNGTYLSKAFDAAGSPQTGELWDSNRTTYGSNNWFYSDIRTWLNGDFYNNAFSNKDVIQDTTQDFALTYIDRSQYTSGSAIHVTNTNISTVLQNYSQAYKKSVTNKVFLVNIPEIVNDIRPVIGNNYYNSSYYYWTRDAISGHSQGVRAVYIDGSINYIQANQPYLVRAAVNLDSGSLKSGDGSINNPYTIE